MTPIGIKLSVYYHINDKWCLNLGKGWVAPEYQGEEALR